MLCLRVARGSRPSTVLRRSLLAAVSAGTGFLLLCALGHALVHPDRAEQSAVRLMWALVPAAATVHLAVAVSRLSGDDRRSGLAATGYGAFRLPLAAAGTALPCVLGSLLALLVFVVLRGNLLGAEPTLPVAGTITLLALVPLVGASATVLAHRTRQERPGHTGPAERDEQDESAERERGGLGTHPRGQARADLWEASDEDRPAAPTELPWGAVLVAAGLVIELFADRLRSSARSGGITLPGGLGDLPSAMLAGWALTAVGFVLAGPGLVHLTGQLLASARPGVLRLLAGRGLQTEAERIGRPLGVLCAAGSAGLAAARLTSVSADPRPGPLTALGAALVLVCVMATVAIAAEESRGARMPVTATLTRLGAPVTMLRQVSAVRFSALLALLAPLTWVVAELTALPLYI